MKKVIGKIVIALIGAVITGNMGIFAWFGFGHYFYDSMHHAVLHTPPMKPGEYFLAHHNDTRRICANHFVNKCKLGWQWVLGK